MQKQYGITVGEALSLDTVNRLVVVAGHDGLERMIKLVNVIEVPDIMDWLFEGEFLLTTGYSFREYPELMNKLVPRMAEANCAGLAIKTKRYLSEIPAEVIAGAQQHHIPLLEVPYDLSFAEVIAPILGVIFSRQAIVLDKLEQAHKKLMAHALEGGPLEELCKETGKIISNPVAIMDREGFLIVNENCPDRYKFELFFSEGSVEIKKEKLRLGNIKEVKYLLEYTQESEQALTIKAIRIPIIAGNYLYGHMVAIINNPIYEPDVLIMERAATIAALEYTKRKAIYEIEKNYYNEFLEILLARDFENTGDIIKRGHLFNINLEMPTAVVVIHDPSFLNINEQHSYKDLNGPRSKEDLLRAIGSYIKQSNTANMIAGIKGNNIIVVAGMSADNPSATLKETVGSLIDHLHVTTGDRMQLKLGVGRSTRNIRNISRSYEEAREALKIAQLSDQTHVVYFDNLGFYKILSEKNRPDLERFVEELLQPVIDYDRHKNGDLIKTLESYYETNRNLKLTSERLYTHYNTVLYRIKKIEELTGSKLDNPENALNMEIAINILKLFRNVAL